VGFESAGALALVNEYSGLAVIPAHYIAFTELKHRTSLAFTLTLREVSHEATIRRRICGFHWHRLGRCLYALQKYNFLILFPGNPATLAKYRQAFTPSRAKDDPTDADLALELLRCHRDKLRCLKPESAAMRTLQQLVEQRRGLVGDKVRITNRVTYALKQYFPKRWIEGVG
jgi:hypothetical protein